MGMYPVQNYGKDFNEAFTGMGNYINSVRKTDSDLEQRKVDNARQAKQDEQSSRVADAQITASKASTDKNIFDLEKSKQADAKTKDLERIMDMVSTYSIDTANVNSAPKKYSKEYLKSFSNGVTELSNLPNNISDPATRQRFKADNLTVSNGYSLLGQMPVSDQLYLAKRGDAPEIDATLAAKERLMPKAQFTKVHNNDQYGDYTLANLEQIGVVSDKGTAKTADWFSIKDKDGNPIYEKDEKGNVITVPDPATGAPVPKKVLVPSTFGHTNDPDSKVKFDLSQLEQAKSQLGLQMLNVYEGMTPEQQKQVQDLNIAKLRASTNPAAIAFMERWDGKRDKKGVALADGAIYIDPTTGNPIGPGNPKTEKDLAKTVKVDVGKGLEQTFQWNNDTKKFDIPVGKPGAKHNPRPDNSGKGSKEMERESRADIDKSFAAFNARRNAFNKARPAIIASGDPVAINEMNTEKESIDAESAAYTAKTTRHYKDFKNIYEPGAAAPPVRRSAGMAPPNNHPPQAQQKAAVTAGNKGQYSMKELIEEKARRAQQSAKSKKEPVQASNYNFFDDVNKKFTADQAVTRRQQQTQHAVNASAAAANTAPDVWVTAVDANGRQFRTTASKARFNAQSLKWELK